MDPYQGGYYNYGPVEDWALTLVNSINPLPYGFEPQLAELSNGSRFDARAISHLEEMLNDMRNEGLSPVVCSAYRSIETQQRLFDRETEAKMNEGFTRDQAIIEAAKSVAYPGTSEHNLGLACDIVSAGYQILDDRQAETPEVQWLFAHSSDYGFILRYSAEKTNITGIIYEPWHFRYVGIATAKEITAKGVCFEEYLNQPGVPIAGIYEAAPTYEPVFYPNVSGYYMPD
jgi:D-alanyl-D-alanine carboxypeptidase